ncbi:hypothetical protein PMO31116_04128 [Pandoraea morbifera]|uniref:Uncharacterized protein n=1 Tax=Pandoraea morbifera TaxID=2508300 RepID=A0A5E4XYI2_9BURK|nr:hypothetical protein [Pandoraea morbifera]VVE41162.1 hypothetical protein PMO31116_04128 [Pandoraea morbifera]
MARVLPKARAGAVWYVRLPGETRLRKARITEITWLTIELQFGAFRLRRYAACDITLVEPVHHPLPLPPMPRVPQPKEVF